MTTITYQLEDLTCPSCIKKIENAIKKQDCVDDVKVLFNSGKVKVDFNETGHAEQIASVLNKLGYPVQSIK